MLRFFAVSSAVFFSAIWHMAASIFFSSGAGLLFGLAVNVFRLGGSCCLEFFCGVFHVVGWYSSAFVFCCCP